MCIAQQLAGTSAISQLATQLTSFPLKSESAVVYACDYKSPPITTLDFVSSNMPCNNLYPNSTVVNHFDKTFKADMIESIKTLSVNKGRRCFKLKLTTSCRQRWFQPNVVSRSVSREEESRDECFGNGVCIGCEISNQYPQENCEVFTFGKNEVSVTKVFVVEVDIYQNLLGETSYKGLTTKDNYMTLGGEYGEKLFFYKLDTPGPKAVNFTLNVKNNNLLSFDVQRIFTFDNQIIEFQNRQWYLYDGNHLVDKKSVDDASANLNAYFASIADRIPPSSTVGAPVDSSLQNYQDFFNKAQTNITNWYTNYLDCRIKKVTLGVYNHLSVLLQKVGLPREELDENLLDFGPGEIIVSDKMSKYQCYLVTVGELISKRGCISYRNGEKQFNVSTLGELTMRNVCSMSVRVNGSHILKSNTDDTLTLMEYKFLTMNEEEQTLNAPPRVTDQLDYINGLVLNSSALNLKSTVGVQDISTLRSASDVVDNPSVDSTQSSYSWISLVMIISLVVCSLAIIGGVIYVIAKGLPENFFRRRSIDNSNLSPITSPRGTVTDFVPPPSSSHNFNTTFGKYNI